MKRAKTPTFLLELPLRVDWSQERRLRAHLEAARCLDNALLSEGNARLHQMRNDPAWQTARAIPHSHKQERARVFSALRNRHHFSEYQLHEYAKVARVSWIAGHIESTMAQTRARRAYQAVNRVCVGKAKRVRFRSSGWGLDSVEGKRNDVGMRFVLDPNAGDGGFLIWNEQVIPALIDLGPSTLAMVPRQVKGADLVTFCEELAPDSRKKRRLQRKMERQRRANNPENYDERGQIKKHGTSRLSFRESKRYQAPACQY